VKDLDLHPTDQRLVLILRALGNPARVLILNEIRRLGTCHAGALADHLPLSPSTIGEHLRRLREAGIIASIDDGPVTRYHLNAETVAWLCAKLEAIHPASRLTSPGEP
jgi:ArsR family transcriptional regulator